MREGRKEGGREGKREGGREGGSRTDPLLYRISDHTLIRAASQIQQRHDMLFKTRHEEGNCECECVCLRCVCVC